MSRSISFMNIILFHRLLINHFTFQDALILQRLVLQTKVQLSEDDESVPDVAAAVQEILATIFTALYNHQDEEGRCYSDSMAELPEHDIVDGKKYVHTKTDLTI